MIKLENVSTERLINSTKNLSLRSQIFKDAYGLLISYNIRDYQMLKDFLESKKLEFDSVFEFLRDELMEVESDIENANSLGLKPEIFTFDIYNDSLIDDKTLRITDQSNKGDILLYTNPMERGGARINQLKYMSIDEIKHLASHLSSYKLQNAFTKRRNFGIDTVKRVVSRVNFYEQQVLRQASETDERDINLFMLNKREKDEIVESQIKDIALYFVDNALECVWGNLPSSQKLRMMRAVLAVRGENVLEDRRRLINAVSNYTTLSELEQDVIKKKTLDRFIVR